MIALKPYMIYIKIALAAIILSVAFAGGCKVQKGIDAEEISSMKSKLTDAAGQLRAAAKALRDQNTANKAYMDKQAERRKEEADAVAVALEAEKKAKKRAKAFQSQYEHAMKNPTCAALLNADINKVCGL